jgi:hypothetical protein
MQQPGSNLNHLNLRLWGLDGRIRPYHVGLCRRWSHRFRRSEISGRRSCIRNYLRVAVSASPTRRERIWTKVLPVTFPNRQRARNKIIYIWSEVSAVIEGVRIRKEKKFAWQSLLILWWWRAIYFLCSAYSERKLLDEQMNPSSPSGTTPRKAKRNARNHAKSARGEGMVDNKCCGFTKSHGKSRKPIFDEDQSDWSM